MFSQSSGSAAVATRIIRGTVPLLIGLAAPFPVAAQVIQVQQPVVRQFGVDTAVVVPDRGSTFLGGVSRTAAARQTYGPWPWGTALGFERSHSFLETHVWIHDHAVLDAQVLSTVESSLPPLTSEQRQQFARDVLRTRSAATAGGVSRPQSASSDRDRALMILRNRRP